MGSTAGRAEENSFEFILNGQPVRAVGISPNLTLLEFLRGRGLTGAKEGCAEGDCGACSIAVLERGVRGRGAWRAINSCLVPVVAVAGREVVSVEGVAGEALHPVQEAMVRLHGSQCGYCTPGIICALFEGYYRREAANPEDIDEQLGGNLCRCTGYRPIRDAALAAWSVRRDPGADRFARAAARGPRVGPLHYAADARHFLRPVTLPEVFRALKKFPEARLVAGATELGLEITKRFHQFPGLISLEAVPALRAIRRTTRAWQVGAAATLTEIQEAVAADVPVLGAMLRWFGSRQIRNRATMGGNLVTASPIGDCAPVLLALEARVVLASARRERTLPVREFFTGYRRTALERGELLRSILIPRGPARRGRRRLCRFFKVSKRQEMDISTVAACFTVELDRKDVVRHARIACGGVAPTPARAFRVEEALLGRVWNEDTITLLRPLLRSEFTPISDTRGSAEFRADVLASLLEKFFDETRPGAPAEPEPEPPAPPAPPAAPPHESARAHVTGEAIYTDDQTAGLLEVWPVCADTARGRIQKRCADAARRSPGIAAVLFAEDIPGSNDVGVVRHDEVLLAAEEVLFHGQLVALVVGDSPVACRAAAALIDLHVEPQPPVLTLREAMAAGSFHTEPNFIRRGDVVEALARAPLSLRGEFECGGQEHFYLETQAAWAKPGEDGTMFVASSTQHPSEVQQVVARVLGVPGNKVVVQSLRLGGGFGGKETQAAPPAALAALAAWKTGRAVRVRFNRDQDMMLTGKRHPFFARFDVGFDAEGRLHGARIELFSNGGWALDLSQAVTDRAVFHLDNAYHIPHVEFSGRVCRTNLASNTAFRGFGGPQGMLVIEEILDRVARRTGLAPETVRERNLYRGTGETNTTPYGQDLADDRIQRVWHELKAGSDFAARRVQLRAWNAAHPHRKRGLAITPVKFGISFTVTHLNQAGALVLWFQDGSVQVNHGGTEMGQGIHTNIRALAARALGVAPTNVRVMPTSTDKVPNTSATAASCGTDLNGAAVLDACETLRARVTPAAIRLLTRDAAAAVTPERLVFADDVVFDRRRPGRRVPLAEVLQRAYLERVSLAATGYYRTPGIHYDRAAGRGRPFHYFAVGAAVAEVEVDACTGRLRVRRVDVLQDAGEGINVGVNRGQVEGGFVQGMGWLTGEELVWDAQGRLLTHSPDTYKIPACHDAPRDFRVAFLTDTVQAGVVHGSKAVGEPPLMLALSVREAIRDAVAAFGSGAGEIALPSPATTEAIYRAIQQWRQGPGRAATR